MPEMIRIHPLDNVAVALRAVAAGVIGMKCGGSDGLSGSQSCRGPVFR